VVIDVETGRHLSVEVEKDAIHTWKSQTNTSRQNHAKDVAAKSNNKTTSKMTT